MPRSSASIRSDLVEALRLDLVGPDNDHPFAAELLPDPPSRWYLTGVLAPKNAPIDQRAEPVAEEEIDSAEPPTAGDDGATPDAGSSAVRRLLPISIGLSVLVPKGVDELVATVRWGDYSTETTPTGRQGYRRTPREESIPIPIPPPGEGVREVKFAKEKGIGLVVSCREVPAESHIAGRLPDGTRSVSVFVENGRNADEELPWRAFAFQVELRLTCALPFVPRPDLRFARPGSPKPDWDEQVADLHYRDAMELVVGHGASATALLSEDGACREVRTTWLPTAAVHRVEARPIEGVELGMEALGALPGFEEARARLSPLVVAYRAWIDREERKLDTLDSSRRATAEELILYAKTAADRIEAGIGLLESADVLDAFRLANRAMAEAGRRRDGIQKKVAPSALEPPRWRPFQLAFLLMTLRGIAEPKHDDRNVVDLLFFPTGGGKTEAYLGLAAFAMVLRRLRNPGPTSGGVTVLMRYTLRLLTLDQLGRAAGLVCALELEREKQRDRLGDWPFEIGLWVGSAATPNRMGMKGDKGPGADRTAYARTQCFRLNSQKNPSPIPIESCPWCGTKFESRSFRLVPNENAPENLVVHCGNLACDFSGDRALPVLGVDEPIYRRVPPFLIATLDKFAALPWTGATGTLFGLADRFEPPSRDGKRGGGWFGPCDPGRGKAMGQSLLPPDLVIQDELHLISGPLGTIAGVYETAIDALATRTIDGREVRPKIIASTATVRRADAQIRALFGRPRVEVFPPPGIDRIDSFFAVTDEAGEEQARQYVGAAAPGRSLKVVLLRVGLALLSAGESAWKDEGGKKNEHNPADPYMTLLGYFNSLRELGGSRRIIEDELRTRLQTYSRRRRLEPEDRLFSDRTIGWDALELTSRVSTDQVAQAKRRLALGFRDDEKVDVALATNMISVGLDIVRLGLMVVLGQPKTSAEYIQTTSRVGRDPLRPGLVVTLLNVHKPRDRSHYERFEAFHRTFYRAVEPTSVTPFSPRALDRALAAALVGLVRHGDAVMTPPANAERARDRRRELDRFAEVFAIRAAGHDASRPKEDVDALRALVAERARRLLDDWQNIAEKSAREAGGLRYQRWEAKGAPPLLRDFLDSDLPQLPTIHRKFRANRSMRDVEVPVDIVPRPLDDWGDSK